MNSTPEGPTTDAPPQHRLARMPRVVTVLVALIVAAHLAIYLVDASRQDWLFETFGVIPARIESGQLGIAGLIASLCGNVFLHAGFLHLFFNAALILQTGELVAERFGRSVDGAFRFLALFFASAAAGALVYVAFNQGSQMPAIGASGAACGLFAAYLIARFPDVQTAIRSPLLWQMSFYFLLVNVALAAAVRMFGVLPIAWEAHLGGFIAGALLYPLLAPRMR